MLADTYLIEDDDGTAIGMLRTNIGPVGITEINLTLYSGNFVLTDMSQEETETGNHTTIRLNGHVT